MTEPNTAIRARTARKAHRCEECRWRSILPGHRYEIHTIFPGHDVVSPDRPITLKRCMGHAIAADVAAAFSGRACGTYCHALEPCVRPFGHVGDCSCRQEARDAQNARAAQLTPAGEPS